VAVHAAKFPLKRGWALLCRWGLDLSKAKGCVATVMSSEMGKLLYEAVGFEVKGEFVVRIDGEDEKLEK